jgi:uncharacterized protein YndB with AHSA1/START domain
VNPLIVRRSFRASAERLFDAWTQVDELKRRWGPSGVVCAGAEIDLKVGGRYRIGNRFPDGSIMWIRGEYQVIDRPSLLVYTWQLEGVDAMPERVTVKFISHGEETELVVTHEDIPDSRRVGHERGWIECLEGLDRLMA